MTLSVIELITKWAGYNNSIIYPREVSFASQLTAHEENGDQWWTQRDRGGECLTGMRSESAHYELGTYLVC
jgi:hypothetical protein